ncbi:MAG: pyruvate formate lyase family protein, partial [Bacilli bacterium]|nr:pyruvate formate lyase family protein [Bacilli bacterium]
MKIEWKKFISGNWNLNIDVEDFILKNYKYYDGDDSFLSPISKKTKVILDKYENLEKEEIKKNVWDIETEKIAGINNFLPGYIDKKNEVIVGLQTDAPLKRIVNPYGGIRMVN